MTFKLLAIAGAIACLTSFSCAEEPKSPQSAPPSQQAETKEGERDLSQTISGEALRNDLQQFRAVLKQEWILSNLNGATFDAAIDNIEREADTGMTVAELALRLQRVLCLGMDGHAQVVQLGAALQSVGGAYPDYSLDLCGDRYVAYRRIPSPEGNFANAKKKYKLELLRADYPYVTAIDGVPIERWVEAATPYVPRGPKLSMRSRSMSLLAYLPYFRGELTRISHYAERF